jgi:hypothetical protein
VRSDLPAIAGPGVAGYQIDGWFAAIGPKGCRMATYASLVRRPDIQAE